MNQGRASVRLLFASACAGILSFGIVLAVLGTVLGLSGTRERLHVDLAEQGTLFLLLYLGIFLASLLAGPLIDFVGNKWILLVSSVLVCLSMILLAAARSMPVAGCGSILLGFGGGGLNTCTNALVSDVYGRERGRMLNLLGIFFGIGALFVPLLGAVIEGTFSPQQLLAFCAILPGICAIVYAGLSFPGRAETQDRFSWKDAAHVVRWDSIWLVGLVLFFESGNEACVGGWTSTYANSVGLSPRTATLILCGYWAALMLSRIVAAGLLKVVRKEQLVVGAAVLAIIGGAVLLSTVSVFWLSAGVVLIGLSYGPIFPTTLAIAGDRYSRSTGTVFGLLFSIALVGGMIFPWAVGQISQNAAVRTGMVIPLLGAAAICCFSAILLRRSQLQIAS